MRRWSMGSVVYVGMAAALIAVPSLLIQSWPPEGAGKSASGESEGPRLVERVVEVEGWASEGFAGLAAEFSSRPEDPTWEEVLRAMERRGCTELRYALRVRSVLSDGSQDDQTLVRCPYHEPQWSEEFIRYLRGGPDAALWLGPGDPPWIAAATGDDPSALSPGSLTSPSAGRTEGVVPTP